MGLFGGLFDIFGGNSEDYYKNIKTPDTEQMKLALDKYVQQGILTPEDAQAVMQDPSAFQSITSDPKFKAAQTEALTGLQDVAHQGGLTSIDKARMNDIANQESTRERGARDAITQNAAQRGTSGSGLEFLSKLTNEQNSAANQSNRDTQVAGDAENRALDALINSGSMAGNMRNQDFNEQSNIAQAKDRINAFNTNNRNNFNMYNTTNRNNAMAGNLANKQGIANSNVDLSNRQQEYNKSLPELDYRNKMDYAGARSGAFNTDQGRKRRGIDDVESGVGSIASKFFGG